MPYKDRDKRLAAKKRWREKDKLKRLASIPPVRCGSRMFVRPEGDQYAAVLQFTRDGREVLCATDASPIPLLRYCIEFNYTMWAKVNPGLAKEWN